MLVWCAPVGRIALAKAAWQRVWRDYSYLAPAVTVLESEVVIGRGFLRINAPENTSTKKLWATRRSSRPEAEAAGHPADWSEMHAHIVGTCYIAFAD